MASKESSGARGQRDLGSGVPTTVILLEGGG